eukprot:COSAG05_NODE_2860_length_2561_cov_4.612510_3_plen_57_part_00
MPRGKLWQAHEDAALRELLNFGGNGQKWAKISTNTRRGPGDKVYHTLRMRYRNAFC